MAEFFQCVALVMLEMGLELILKHHPVLPMFEIQLFDQWNPYAEEPVMNQRKPVLLAELSYRQFSTLFRLENEMKHIYEKWEKKKFREQNLWNQ